jgi:hypothetical protein
MIKLLNFKPNKDGDKLQLELDILRTKINELIKESNERERYCDPYNEFK